MLLAMIFFADLLHGLGPDHLAVVTAFGAVARWERVYHEFLR